MINMIMYIKWLISAPGKIITQQMTAVILVAPVWELLEGRDRVCSS